MLYLSLSYFVHFFRRRRLLTVRHVQLSERKEKESKWVRSTQTLLGLCACAHCLTDLKSATVSSTTIRCDLSWLVGRHNSTPKHTIFHQCLDLLINGFILFISFLYCCICKMILLVVFLISIFNSFFNLFFWLIF